MNCIPYKAGDETAILNLFEVCFKKPLAADYWRWRFEHNPAGLKMIMLMWDHEKLVGHYALSPVNMIIESENHLTGLSMTTMTHPDYTGKGIFQQLALELYNEQHRHNNLTMVWGFP